MTKEWNNSDKIFKEIVNLTLGLSETTVIWVRFL